MSSPTFLWADASCNGKTELFFSVKYEEILKAETICKTCPRLAECKVLSVNEGQGVWAGTYRNSWNGTSRRRYREWKAGRHQQLYALAEKLGVDISVLKDSA